MSFFNSLALPPYERESKSKSNEKKRTNFDDN